MSRLRPVRSLTALIRTCELSELPRSTDELADHTPGIIDEIVARSFDWSGRLEEQDFLARLYEMDELPLTDRRFSSAEGDVWQHRVRNRDWDDDWVFHDDRFNLLNGPDEVFLRLLAETVHPVLRRRRDEVETIVAMYNQHLRQDGVELGWRAPSTATLSLRSAQRRNSSRPLWHDPAGTRS